MKVCESWLSDWTQTDLPMAQIIDSFTMAGLEVGSCEPAAPMFINVVVAEVLETRRHPQADKLTICKVLNGAETVQIVCGAANVREGLKVALAKPGAHLPGGLNIAAAALRGEMSYGMLCSASELGCAAESAGIWELPHDAPVGQDLREYLALNENIISFELTPNRGDCFSALGLARELAALTNKVFTEQIGTAAVVAHEETLAVHVKEPQLCPRYTGRIIKGIRPHAISPLWLREKLRRVGVRDVHPVVDCLNYTMFYLGMPLHAFDLYKINPKIEVTYAEKAAEIELINGKKVMLEIGTPIVTDGLRPIAIAGVMGTSDSAIEDDTTDIFIESAFFNPVQIAGQARRYGLSTDAATRYERGVDAQLPIKALEFATQLIISLVGGEPGPIVHVENHAELPAKVVIKFNPELFVKRTGVNISTSVMKDMLLRLHFSINDCQHIWEVEVPSYRFDISSDVDLVEELLRLYGYANIPAIPLHSELKPGIMASSEQKTRTYSQHLSVLGYNEVINYAFVAPKIQQMLFPQVSAISLLNPISPELSQMRVSLWPGLVTTLMYNSNRQQQLLQIFECGVTFAGTANNAQENCKIAGLLYGDAKDNNWCSPEHEFDFYDGKGHVTHLLRAHGVTDVKFEVCEHSALHPGQAAKIIIENTECGIIGALHPKIQQELDLQCQIILWELDIDKVAPESRKKHQKISKFPCTRRDISFLVASDVPVADILSTIKKVISCDILKDVQVFDVYHGAEIAAGYVSLALACIFQDNEKTLADADILAFQEKILVVLKQEFNIKLRDGINEHN